MPDGPGAKKVKGFQTGDMVRAVVTSGKKVGTYVGRVAVRTTGSFNVITQASTVQGISQKHCQLLHRMDGYSYQFGTAYPRAQAPRKEDLLPPHSSSQGSVQVAR